MPSKEQFSPVSRGVRWLKFAKQLASRYRLCQRRGAAMLWARRLTRGWWLRNRWLVVPSGSAPWQLNLGLSVHLRGSTPGVFKLRLPYGTSERWQPASSLRAAGEVRGQDVRISNHLANSPGHASGRKSHRIRRFLTAQVPLALRPMRVLEGRALATAVRPVLRENLRVEHRLVSRLPGEGARREEGNSSESRISAAAVSAPVAPVRAPEVNIAQIADQVMRQLDHRISAWRERRGRS